MSIGLPDINQNPSNTFEGALLNLLDAIQASSEKTCDLVPPYIELAQKLSFAIGVLRYARADYMPQTIHKIPLEVMSIFDELKALVQFSQVADGSRILELQGRLQAIRDNQGLNHVTGVQLTYHVVNDQARVVLAKISGDFHEDFQAYRTMLNKPALNISGVLCALQNAEPCELTFRVPNCILHNRKDSYKRVQATLIVPIELRGKFQRWVPCNYSFPLVALPDKPGELSIEYESRIKKIISSSTRVFRLNLERAVEIHHVAFTVYPDAGYAVHVSHDPSITVKNGAVSEQSWELNKDKIECRFVARASAGEVLTYLDFLIDFYQEREEVGLSRVESHPLIWGCSKLFKPHFGERIGHIVFRSFGTVCRIASPEELKLPFIKVKKIDDAWTVSVDKP